MLWKTKIRLAAVLNQRFVKQRGKFNVLKKYFQKKYAIKIIVFQRSSKPWRDRRDCVQSCKSKCCSVAQVRFIISSSLQQYSYHMILVYLTTTYGHTYPNGLLNFPLISKFLYVKYLNFSEILTQAQDVASSRLVILAPNMVRQSVHKGTSVKSAPTTTDFPGMHSVMQQLPTVLLI